MSENVFYENKIEEALQLLSVNNELLEKQNKLLQDMINKMDSCCSK